MPDLTRRFVVCLSVCHFVLVFFSPFSIAITSLGEERANLSAFRTFVRFVGFLFFLGSGKGCDLWLWHSLDISLTFFDPTNTHNLATSRYKANKWTQELIQSDPYHFLIIKQPQKEQWQAEWAALSPKRWTLYYPNSTEYIVNLHKKKIICKWNTTEH